MYKMIQTIIQLPIGFIVGLSGALIPGPLLAYTMAKSSTYGARTGPLATIGHILVELAVLALIALGLGIVLKSQLFQIGFGLLGGIILIVSGIEGISKLKQNPEPKNIAGTKYHPILGGVLFSTVLNPTVIFWWATVGVATIMEALIVASIAGVAFWLIGHFLSDLFWYSLISVSVARGKKVLGLKGYRALLIFCAIVLLVLGSYFTLKYGLLAL